MLADMLAVDPYGRGEISSADHEEDALASPGVVVWDDDSAGIPADVDVGVTDAR